jgi:hypothetical protein
MEKNNKIQIIFLGKKGKTNILQTVGIISKSNRKIVEIEANQYI